mmetsp:Transcript_27760/g.93293  ORF Transcript_27760/g.93293 Transcript_27760/m.93293 type:complete len:239 (-) Transcript_27760:6-722(-)
MERQRPSAGVARHDCVFDAAGASDRGAVRFGAAIEAAADGARDGPAADYECGAQVPASPRRRLLLERALGPDRVLVCQQHLHDRFHAVHPVHRRHCDHGRRRRRGEGDEEVEEVVGSDVVRRHDGGRAQEAAEPRGRRRRCCRRLVQRHGRRGHRRERRRRRDVKVGGEEASKGEQNATIEENARLNPSLCRRRAARPRRARAQARRAACRPKRVSHGHRFESTVESRRTLLKRRVYC